MRIHIKDILTKAKTIIRQNSTAFLLFLLAALLRLYNLPSHVTFLGDQGRDAIIIKRILTFEHWPAVGPPTSIGQVFLGPFYYYFIAPWLLLWNYNPVGLAFGVAFLSIFGIVLAYFWLKKELKNWVAFIFLYLVTFSAVLIEYSRFSWNPNLLPLFTFFTLLFFYLALTRKSWFYPLIFGSLFALSLQLHYLAMLLIPSFLVLFTWSFIRNKAKLLVTKKILLSLLSFIIFSVPLIFFDLRHGFINSKTLLKTFQQEQVITGGSYWQKLIASTTSFAQYVFALPEAANFALALLIFVLIVSGILIVRKKSLLTFVFYLTTLLFLLFFPLLNSPRYPHYFGPAYLPFFVAFAFLLGQRAKECKVCRVIILFFLFIYLMLNINKVSFFFKPGSQQVWRAERIARSVLNQVEKTPYQVVALPFTETHSHYRYFLELLGERPLAEDTLANPQELYVLCFKEECNVTNDPQWQIAAFTNKKVAKIWTVDNIKIYKVVHGKAK